jgi:DNA polymerase-3 subunit beta
MHLTVNTKQFKEAVKNCNVYKNNVLPILRQLYLKAEANILTVYGTDLKVYTSFTIDANIQDEDIILIDYKKLSDALKTIKDKEITLKTENDYLFINNIKLRIDLDYDDFPLPEAFPSDLAVSISGKELLKGISKTIYATYKEKTQSSFKRLKGICFSFYDSKLDFVATDGHRLALYSTDANNQIEGKYIILEKVFKTLKNLLKPDANIQFAVKDNFAFFKFDNVLIQVALINDVYPDYRQVIPTTFNIELKLDRYLFTELLNEFITLIEHPEKPIVLTLNNNKLTITNTDNDVMIERVYDLDAHYPEFKIGFNAKYIYEAISVIEDKNVIVKFIDKDTQAVIIPENPEERYIAVVMPIKLD